MGFNLVQRLNYKDLWRCDNVVYGLLPLVLASALRRLERGCPSLFATRRRDLRRTDVEPGRS